LVAFYLPHLGAKQALWLIFPALVWQGFGGGFTANAWQNMVAKIIPKDLHGTFFATQAAAANGMAGISAILAGLILTKVESPLDFVACFFLAAVMMVVSYIVLGQTREHEAPPPKEEHPQAFWGHAREILKRDRNFVIFLGVRSLSQFASMAFAFYLIYAVFEYGMSEAMAGVMTSVLLIAQVAFSPLMGRLGDRWSHRGVMCIGALAAALSALLAWMATSREWFYPVFILEAVSIVAIWIVPIALTVSFARRDEERPIYIGLSNTVTAPPRSRHRDRRLDCSDKRFGLMFFYLVACGLLMAALLAIVVKELQAA
jgi:MFS family permease